MFTSAFAQTPAAPAPPAAQTVTDFITQTPVVPLVIIMLVWYFFFFRPRNIQLKERSNLVKNVRRGDSIVTSGGLIGKVSRVVDDGEVELEIAPNVKVRIARAMITDVRSKGEPVKEQG